MIVSLRSFFVLAATCAALAACVPAHAEEGAAAIPFLRFLDAPAPGQPLTTPPHLSVSFGGRRFAAVMDTGSTGVLVAADMIPGWEQLRRLGPARLTYSSSGRVMEGWWVETSLEIAGRDGAAVRTVPMPVMAVTGITCLSSARNCRKEVRPRHVAMLGIGFARQGDRQAQSTPDHNPFLRLAGRASDGTHRGYVITRTGVTPGVDGTMAGFQTIPLSRSTAFNDWAAAPGCFTVGGRMPPACGTVLVDTGVARAFLTVPPVQLGGDGEDVAQGGTLRPGTPVTVRLGPEPPAGAAPDYTFRAQDRADPVAPRDIVLVRPGQSPTFLNTSLHILNGFDYLFDAERGLVGLRSAPLGSASAE